jgi:hypothetical protein
MTPEKLKQKLAASGVTATLQGEEIKLRKFGAKGVIAIQKLLLSIPKNELNQPIDLEDTATFYAFVLSKSAADDAGNLLFDSDEGRAALEDLDLEELVPLAEQALKLNGMAKEPDDAAKKNLTN